jgi:hypothetical protein
VTFLAWGLVYVILKWTLGIWIYRRVKARRAARRQTTALSVNTAPSYRP